jgi:hypothetical protein
MALSAEGATSIKAWGNAAKAEIPIPKSQAPTNGLERQRRDLN